MERSRTDRAGARGGAAFAFSLLLHLAVGLWLARALPVQRVAAPVPASPPIEIDVVQVSPGHPTVPGAPAAKVPPPRPRARPPSKDVASGAGSAAGSGKTTVSEIPPAADAPRRIDLLPPPSSVVLSPPELSAGPGGMPFATGRTLRNRPLTPEERAAAIAVEAGRVKERVDGWIDADIGMRRVQTGLVDPYFGAVRGALQAAVEKNAPDGMPGRSVGQQLMDSVLGGAGAYGRTGNPYGEGQVPGAEPAERELINPGAELARRYAGAGGTPRLQRCIDQGKLLDDFLSGKFGGGVTAIVELRQAPDGKLLGVRLASTSGFPAYDRHVLSVAPVALESLPPPPSKGFGIRLDGITSLWAFEGRVKYKRPLREWDPIAGGLTGALVGTLYGLACPGLGPPVTFDPVTGEMELIDLLHPKFTCQVKLLKAG